MIKFNHAVKIGGFLADHRIRAVAQLKFDAAQDGLVLGIDLRDHQFAAGTPFIRHVARIIRSLRFNQFIISRRQIAFGDRAVVTGRQRLDEFSVGPVLHV
ncbi:hypothetical protein D3C76_833100 [compost metagenome]